MADPNVSGPPGNLSGSGPENEAEVEGLIGQKNFLGTNIKERTIEERSKKEQKEAQQKTPDSHRGLNRFRLVSPAQSANAASNARLLGVKSHRLTFSQASAAPASRSMPLSSHSTLSGPL